MKTITITFRQADQVVAVAVGTFATLPGPGPVIWKGSIDLRDPYRGPLPTTHYAETFTEAMQALATHHGLTAEVTEDGTWIIHPE